jgi:hypothetical protein
MFDGKRGKFPCKEELSEVLAQHEIEEVEIWPAAIVREEIAKTAECYRSDRGNGKRSLTF